VAESFEQRLAGVDSIRLTSIVRKMKRNNDLNVTKWSHTRIGAGGGISFGSALSLCRFSGEAVDLETHRNTSWSLMLKAVGRNGNGSKDPAAWNYWKREILVNQSGIIETLTDDFAAPVCFDIDEFPDDEYWIWMEDIGDDQTDTWSIDRYCLAARHLGQFNGTYLVAKSVPGATWLSTGRVREWIGFSDPIIAELQARRSTESLRPWINDKAIERILRLWTDRHSFLRALDSLPKTFCHHDAFRRNLIGRTRDSGVAQTVAFDWAVAGTGAIGEEISNLIFTSLAWLDVDFAEAGDLQEGVISGYIDGLRDAGWKGDANLVRFGCLGSAALQVGIAWAGGGALSWFNDREKDKAFPKRIGHSLERVVSQLTRLQPYLLAAADEARRLMDTIATK
jgi:hypothetical protein